MSAPHALPSCERLLSATPVHALLHASCPTPTRAPRQAGPLHSASPVQLLQPAPQLQAVPGAAHQLHKAGVSGSCTKQGRLLRQLPRMVALWAGQCWHQTLQRHPQPYPNTLFRSLPAASRSHTAGGAPVVLRQQGHDAVVLVLQRAPVHLRGVRRQDHLRLLQAHSGLGLGLRRGWAFTQGSRFHGSSQGSAAQRCLSACMHTVPAKSCTLRVLCCRCWRTC